MRLLTLAEAAKVTRLSESTLRRVTKRGDGPFLKVEGRWIVYEEELHDWVRGHRSAPEPRPDPMPSTTAGKGRLAAKVIELRRAG